MTNIGRARFQAQNHPTLCSSSPGGGFPTRARGGTTARCGSPQPSTCTYTAPPNPRSKSLVDALPLSAAMRQSLGSRVPGDRTQHQYSWSLPVLGPACPALRPPAAAGQRFPHKYHLSHWHPWVRSSFYEAGPRTDCRSRPQDELQYA